MCSGWFFCGEVVVNCVVDVDGGMGVFGGLKIGHLLQLFFRDGAMGKA